MIDELQNINLHSHDGSKPPVFPVWQYLIVVVPLNPSWDYPQIAFATVTTVPADTPMLHTPHPQHSL